MTLVTRAFLASGLTEQSIIVPMLEAVRGLLVEGNPLAEALSYIWSDRFQCPGEHYSRRLTYQEEEARRGCYHDIKEGVLQTERLPEGVYFIGRSECLEYIEVTLDSEGEPGGQQYYYPVADGPCVEALGWDDELFMDSSVLAKWEERARLRNLLEGSTTRSRIHVNRALRIYKADEDRKRWQAEQNMKLEAHRKAADQDEFVRLLGGDPGDQW